MKYPTPLTFILVIFAALLAPTLCEKKLIFVQELFRHGARYPIYSSKLDFSDYASNQFSSGELTTQGKNMHYLLGKKVYETYWNDLFKGTLFQTRYNNSKFYVKSTDVNRTIESCQSHIMGIFDSLPKLTIDSTTQASFAKPLWPNSSASVGDVFPTATQYHPIPIHVEKGGSSFNNNGDFLKAYSPQNCPKQYQWKLQNQQTSLAKQILNHPRFKAAIDALSKELNSSNVTFETATQFYDNFECGLYAGKKTLPIFNSTQYEREFRYMYVLDLFINLFYSEKQIKTTSSGFFQATVNNIKKVIADKKTQWVIYSAHDTTVANMLAALNFTNTACIFQAYLKGDNINKDTCIVNYPGYTGSIIFQVYQDTLTNLSTFKIRYLGEYRKIPFCQYQEQCSVETLYDWFQTSIRVDNFAATCGLENTDKQFYKGFAILELGVIISFVIYCILNQLKRPKLDIAKLQDNKPKKQLKNPILNQEIED